jgi:hypothetical protein
MLLNVMRVPPARHNRFPLSHDMDQRTQRTAALSALPMPLLSIPATESAPAGPVLQRTIYDGITADENVLEKWRELPDDKKTTGNLYKALIPGELSSGQTSECSALNFHFDRYLVRMEIEGMKDVPKREKLLSLHDKHAAYRRNLTFALDARNDNVPDISAAEKEYLTKETSGFLYNAIDRLMGSFTDAAKAARAYDNRTIDPHTETINQNRKVKQAINSFLARCFPSLPFLSQIVSLVREKPDLFTTGRTGAYAPPGALHVDRWLANPDNKVDLRAFLSAEKGDRKSQAAMLEIKQKISHAFLGNADVYLVLNIWREQEHPLGLDKPFIKGIEDASRTPATEKSWRPLRTSLAEYPVAQNMSDQELIERLQNPQTQAAFGRWALGPLEERAGESSKDFTAREKLRNSRVLSLMNCLAKARNVWEYAATPEALKKAEG